MITFKAKLRKMGNSHGIYIPLKFISDYVEGEILTVAILKEGVPVPTIISQSANEIPEKEKVEIPKIDWNRKPTTTHSSSSRFDMCPKHKGSMKATCGCE